MSLVKVNLTLAGRRIITQLINELAPADINITRMVRAVRDRFELREADRTVEKLTRERAELQAERESDLAKIPESDRLKAALLLEPIEPLTWDDLNTEPHPYTIDDGYLGWLREELNKKTWGADGKAPHSSMLVAVADLVDAVAAAEAC